MEPWATAYKSRLLSCLTKTQYPLNKKFINVIKQTMTKHSPLCQEKPILPPEKKKSFSNPFYVSAPSLFSLCALSCSHSLSVSVSLCHSLFLSLSPSLASFLSSRTKRSSSQWEGRTLGYQNESTDYLPKLTTAARGNIWGSPSISSF